MISASCAANFTPRIVESRNVPTPMATPIAFDWTSLPFALGSWSTSTDNTSTASLRSGRIATKNFFDEGSSTFEDARRAQISSACSAVEMAPTLPSTATRRTSPGCNVPKDTGVLSPPTMAAWPLRSISTASATPVPSFLTSNSTLNVSVCSRCDSDSRHGLWSEMRVSSGSIPCRQTAVRMASRGLPCPRLRRHAGDTGAGDTGFTSDAPSADTADWLAVGGTAPRLVLN